MLKTRIWFRLGAGLVLLLLAAFIALLAWPTAPPGPEAIAKRGLAPPDTSFSITKPATWRTSCGSPRDWVEQGMDNFSHWDMNPWKTKKIAFFEHFGNLCRSEDPKDQAEVQRLLKLGREWYERMLARYPELAVHFRDVPDDKNALLRLMKLVQSKKKGPLYYDFGIPRAFGDQLQNKQPWNPAAVKTWMDANRPLMDELRAIGLMADRSRKGIDYKQMPSVYGDCLATAMLLNARLAAESGDLAGCMEMIRATNGMADHFQQADGSLVADAFAATRIRSLVQDYVFSGILPSIPAGQVNPAEWEQILNPTVRQPAALANLLKASWNSFTPDEILAALADSTNPQLPSDPEALAEAYTRHTLAVVQFYEKLSLGEMPSTPFPEIDTSGLSWRSRKIANHLGEIGDLQGYWERTQLQTGMTQAAFAILKGQPVPNDPIYGKTFQWNPETRELTCPDGPEFSKMDEIRLKLPRL